MKKVLAVIMTIVMAFAFCVPSFAETTEAAGGGFDFNVIIEAIQGILGGITGGSDAPDIGGIIDSIGGIIGGLIPGESSSGGSETLAEITPEQAANIIRTLQRMGTSKADIQASLDEMYNSGRISATSYDNLVAALAAAPEDSTDTPVVDDAEVAEVAAQVISTLKSLGVSNDQLQSVVDSLFERGVIPQNVYDEVTRQINDAEGTTAAGGTGGISDFFGGIIDAITGLFGGGDAAGDGTENPDEFAGTEPTGDTAVISVLSVAAVAGLALVLTKKKKNDK